MLTVATMRCLENTACGVRWAFVVALVCVSNVAVAGFVPAGSGASPAMESELGLSHSLSDCLSQGWSDAPDTTDAGTMDESQNQFRRCLRCRETSHVFCVSELSWATAGVLEIRLADTRR